MITYNKETPILLVAFGNVEIISLIYNTLQRIEPKRLYVFYDSPANKGQDTVQEHFNALLNRKAWNCRVKTFFCKKHTGMNTTMKKALRWFFRQETEGIVLDDFSVPFPAFFALCSCLLEKYRFDERIGHISGWDFRKPEQYVKTKDSYFFSKLINTVGGWASWRRVMKDMDVQIKTFSSFRKQNVMDNIPTHQPFQFYWYYLNHLKNSWNASLEYSNLITNRLSVVPNTFQIPLNEYELPEMIHPDFMVNPVTQELKTQELKYRAPAVTRNKPDSMTFLQEKLLSLNIEAGRRLKIPRIIHQIFEDPAGPSPVMLQMAETWKNKMPDWEYRFWNKQMMCDFMESVCSDFLFYYNSFPFDVQRWDSIRYLILYHIGGLYVDFDYECIKPLDVILSGASCCMGMEPTINGKFYNMPMIVGNALMASTRNHPYMAAVIDDMKANFSFDCRNIVASTGPFMTTRVYERYERKKEVTLLPADLIAPLTMREILMMQSGKAHLDVLKKTENAFAIHYFFGTWTAQTANNKQPQSKDFNT